MAPISSPSPSAAAPSRVPISSAVSAGTSLMSWRASLYWMAAMFIVRTGSRWFELFGESQPSATRTLRASSSGMRPSAVAPRAPFAAVTGHIVTAAPLRATQSTSASSRPSAWASSTLGPSTPSASRYSVGFFAPRP